MNGFFDRLEDRVRGRFSHYPIAYGIVGGIGIVLFWRGVWHTADYLMMWLYTWQNGQSSINLAEKIWWDGPLSFVIGTTILLMIGILVSSFIGNEIIIAGLRGEKKLTEKTEKELETETELLSHFKKEIHTISDTVKKIEEKG